MPTQGVQYSLDVLSQTAKNGVFEIDFKNTLAAYAENNNVEVQKKSAAKRLISSIDAEIQALDTLVAMAGKNKEAKKQAIAVLTETVNKVGIDAAELGQQEAVEKSIEKEKVTDVKSEKSTVLASLSRTCNCGYFFFISAAKALSISITTFKS